MKTDNRQLLLNSCVAFVLAGLIVITLHEVSHFVASLFLHEPAILYPPFAGNHDNISHNHNIIIAATGPIFSLVSGLFIIFTSRGKGQGFIKLFWTWLGFLSAEVGFGYCFIAPFVKTGDTGLVLSLLHSAWFVYALVFIFGVFGYLFLLPKLFGQEISPLVRDKKAFYFAGMYPWLIGTSILLLIYFLIVEVILKALGVGLVSLMGVATIGIFTPWAGYKEKTKKYPLNLMFPAVAIMVTVVIVLLLIFGLSRGLQYGPGPFS